MPFVSCWKMVPCTVEDKDGKQVPAERRCGTIVSCTMLEVAGEDTRTWAGSCTACGTKYRTIVTTAPKPVMTHSPGTPDPGRGKP